MRNCQETRTGLMFPGPLVLSYDLEPSPPGSSTSDPTSWYLRTRLPGLENAPVSDGALPLVMAVGRQGRCRIGRDNQRKLFCICTCSCAAASSPEADEAPDGFCSRNAVKLAASAGNPAAAVAASAHPPVLWSSRRKPGK
ncbi:hypothetical protein KM043_007517 [Ampulex compressa]|nr:hypothetical protein KM043_007517 [Ampulex compressa]